MLRRTLLALSIIPALAAGMMGVAHAQTDGQMPSVIVRPMGTATDDPNGGQWFVTNLTPTETKEIQVQLFNPASVEQTIKLYLADIRFDRKGVPEVTNVPVDVGTWGSFEQPTVTIAPQETMVRGFTLTAPEGADPGDHVGAVVIEHQPEGTGNIRSIKRVAVRLYATLPGDARKDFVIDGVSAKKDSSFFARELTVTVNLRNTGRVRLEPTVQVDTANAKGPELLMSNAVERYVVTRPVTFWGGPMRLRIDAQSRSLGLAGPVRQLRVTVWVIPWHLFAMLAAAAGLVLLARWLVRKRGAKFGALRDDIRRMERLFAMRNGDQVVPGPGTGEAEAEAAIRAASKQARRARDVRTADRLERVSSGPPAREPNDAPPSYLWTDHWAGSDGST